MNCTSVKVSPKWSYKGHSCIDILFYHFIRTGLKIKVFLKKTPHNSTESGNGVNKKYVLHTVYVYCEHKNSCIVQKTDWQAAAQEAAEHKAACVINGTHRPTSRGDT